MRVSVTNKDIFKLAAPISLALLIPQISFLTNTAFLGRLGEQELGVNGISGIFYLTLSMIGYGMANGIQVQMARRSGEGDKEGLARTLTNGVLLSLMFSLGMMVLSLWLAPIIFGLSLHNTDNIVLSINYLFIRVWGLPFLMLTQLLNAFYISTNRSKYLIYGSLVSTLTNIVFDYLFIFGKAGFPKMGLEGAAVASILSEMAYCLTMYSIFYFKRLYREYPVMRFWRFDTELSKRSLKVSAPLIVQYLFSIGGWQVFFIFVEHLGERELASSQILRSVFGIVGIGTWAFASTCNTMVSNIIGQGRQSQVIPLITKVAKLSFLVTLGICVVLLTFSDTFLSLYRDDPALIEFARPSLRVITTATLIMSLSTVLFNGVVGTGNTVINLTIEVICVCSYLVYCYVVIEQQRMPLHWAWGSEFVYWTTLLLISFTYLKSGRWKGKAI
ncbi:MAG: MATE family efflux transporter [Sphingobacteriales bacterium]|nr:MAG: MATE family efflux transporter [Sphingobacteriales bacterium]